MEDFMSNNKWMDDPVLEGISNEKLEMLTKIIEGAKGMEPKQMLTYFIQQFRNRFNTQCFKRRHDT